MGSELLKAAKTWLTARPRLLSLLLRIRFPQFQVRANTNTLEVRRVTARHGHREIWLKKEHAVYLGDVLREFDYYFASVEPDDRPGGIRVCDFSSDKPHRVPGVGIPFVFPGLPEGGATNNAYLDFFQLKPGATVIDLGAYAGLTGYLFAAAVGPAGRVVAVEADPATYRVLEQNVQSMRVAGTTWLVPVHAAIWKQNGTIEFLSEGNMGATVAAHARRKGETVLVRAITLEQLLAEMAIEKVDAIKMDIEGAEYDVLPALLPMLAAHRPRLILEVHRDAAGKIDFDGLCELLATIGYTTRRVLQSETETFPLLAARPKEDVD
jgi:FkbM family methyltransferase